MPQVIAVPYNGPMSDATHDAPAASPGEAARFAVAGSFLDAFAGRDYRRLAQHLDADVRLRATLPGVQVERDGADGIATQFATWFGRADDFEVIDASVGKVGRRVHLHWRVRVSAPPLGPGWHQVEQHLYLDVSHRIDAIDLLCSGFQGDDDG